jgi:hypothetical protein
MGAPVWLVHKSDRSRALTQRALLRRQIGSRHKFAALPLRAADHRILEQRSTLEEAAVELDCACQLHASTVT